MEQMMLLQTQVSEHNCMLFYLSFMGYKSRKTVGMKEVLMRESEAKYTEIKAVICAITISTENA